ncbi:hypothetical protein [Agromyces terreus]|uniref:hypothetical protein n=1 Tax=Agromyces terreus TaxID=424795 RepID=UPI0012ECC9AD|nr:hypothetical protein [Agromyces terreus]
MYDKNTSQPSWMGGGFGWGVYVASAGYTYDGRPVFMDLGNTYGGRRVVPVLGRVGPLMQGPTDSSTFNPNIRDKSRQVVMRANSSSSSDAIIAARTLAGRIEAQADEVGAGLSGPIAEGCMPGANPGVCGALDSNRAGYSQALAESNKRKMLDFAGAAGNIGGYAGIVAVTFSEVPLVASIAGVTAAGAGLVSAGASCMADWNTRSCLVGAPLTLATLGLGNSLVYSGKHVATGLESVSGVAFAWVGLGTDTIEIANIPAIDAWWETRVFP